mgnify:CR=1 FL=1
MAGQKIRIKLAAYDHELVDLAAQRIVDTMSKSGAKISGPIPLPTEKEVVTILRSPHKYKDSREQFEMRTHKRLIDILKPSNKTVEALTSLEQFEIRTHKRIIDIYTPNARLLDSVHLPAGVDIKIKL